MNWQTKWITRHFWVLLCFVPFFGQGQQNPELKALKLLEKSKTENAIKYLEKSLEKDSINPEYYLTYSILYLIDSLPFYNIDTAYQYINTAIDHHKSIQDSKVRAKLEKDGIDSLVLHRQKLDVERTAFEDSKRVHTEAAYIHFITNYQRNTHTDSAIVLRNQVAFQNALQQNTHESYRRFMETYPKAIEFGEAKSRFERLFYDESTSAKTLSSYVSFLEEHPATIYRDLAEEQILELSTARGTPNQFLEFIRKYPTSNFRNLAIHYLYHIDHNKLPHHLWSDSLRKVHALDTITLFPNYKFDVYGFVNDNGKEILPPQFSAISDEYLCEATSANFLLVERTKSPAIVNKAGQTIIEAPYEQVTDLGQGLLWVKNHSRDVIVHKSGHPVLTGAFENVELIQNSLLACQTNTGWQLYTLLGRLIYPHKFDAIRSMGDFVILEREEKMAAVPLTEFIRIDILPVSSPLQFPYSHLELKEGFLYAEQGNNCFLFNSSLKPLLSANAQKIHFIPHGVVVKSEDGYQFYSKSFQETKTAPFKNYVYNDTHLFLRRATGWSLHNDSIVYDSAIVLSNKISVSTRIDSITFFMGSTTFKKRVDAIFRIIKDNSYRGEKEEFLVFSKKREVEVFNLRGRMIFSGEAEKISALGPRYIVIQQSGKKKVINSAGAFVISKPMDAIANYENGIFSLLSKSKFGMYRETDSTVLTPQYDRLLKLYNKSLLIAYKDNGYGLINATKKEPITSFAFEEIRYWNDTCALVKQNYAWKLLNLSTNEFELEDIKNYSIIRDNEHEMIVKVLLGNHYGLLSNRAGEIIPTTYNDIIDIGTKNLPIYLAERNIEEADFHVVIYYNGQGEIIYKQAYESDDYQKIVCDFD